MSLNFLSLQICHWASNQLWNMPFPWIRLSTNTCNFVFPFFTLVCSKDATVYTVNLTRRRWAPSLPCVDESFNSVAPARGVGRNSGRASRRGRNTQLGVRAGSTGAQEGPRTKVVTALTGRQSTVLPYYATMFNLLRKTYERLYELIPNIYLISSTSIYNKCVASHNKITRERIKKFNYLNVRAQRRYLNNDVLE